MKEFCTGEGVEKVFGKRDNSEIAWSPDTDALVCPTSVKSQLAKGRQSTGGQQPDFVCGLVTLHASLARQPHHTDPSRD